MKIVHRHNKSLNSLKKSVVMMDFIIPLVFSSGVPFCQTQLFNKKSAEPAKSVVS